MDLRTGTSFWRTLDTSPVTAEPLEGEVDCEVAVIGGGITGALVSHSLLRAGVETVLLDRRELGTGSTAASTGLLQYEIDVPLVELIKTVGEAHAVHAYRRGLRAINEIEELVESLADDCGFARRSTLYFASQPEDLAGLREEYACRQYFGFDVDFWSAPRLHERTSIASPGAIYSGGDGQIDPLRLTRCLLEQSHKAGLRIFSQTCVRQIHRLPARMVLSSDAGRVNARSVVYAAGYESGQFIANDVGSLHSTYAVASEPLATSAGWPDDCLIWETARPYFYARKTADGRAIIGGEDTEYSDDHAEEGLLREKAAKLVRRFQSLFPAIDFVPACAWAGTFGETKDGLAYIGTMPARDKEYFALGYGGNGITFSQIAARLIVDLLLGRPNDDAVVFRFGR
jgi:glycine/D-amino acid oxidase-like deaminating enzyme